MVATDSRLCAISPRRTHLPLSQIVETGGSMRAQLTAFCDRLALQGSALLDVSDTQVIGLAVCIRRRARIGRPVRCAGQHHGPAMVSTCTDAFRPGADERSTYVLVTRHLVAFRMIRASSTVNRCAPCRAFRNLIDSSVPSEARFGRARAQWRGVDQLIVQSFPAPTQGRYQISSKGGLNRTLES